MLRRAHIAHTADVFPNELCDALLLRQIRVDVGLRCCHDGCPFRRACRLFRSVIAARGNLRSVQRERDLPIVRRIRHEDGRRCLVARRLDARRIELEQELSALYRIALCDMRRKMLSRKLHGIHADVDQEIHPV